MRVVERAARHYASIPTAAPEPNIEVLEAQIARLCNRMQVAVIFGGQKSALGTVINPTTTPQSWGSYEAVEQDRGRS
jgi:hypothetical protein